MLRLLFVGALLLATDALVLGGVCATSPRACVSMMAKSKTKMVKVLLSTDVEGLGPKGTVVEVKSAYAQNVLVPNKLGAVPTKELLEQLAEEQAKAAEAAKAAKKTAEADKARLQQKYGKGMIYEVQVNKSVQNTLSPTSTTVPTAHGTNGSPCPIFACAGGQEHGPASVAGDERERRCRADVDRECQGRT